MISGELIDQIDLILMVPGQKVLHSLRLTSELGGLGLPANVRMS